MDKPKKQPKVKCKKCKREIKQEFNDKTQCFEYAEVFRKYRNDDKDYYYCNECYQELQDLMKGEREKVFKKFNK